jgi:hypothetical protein
MSRSTTPKRSRDADGLEEGELPDPDPEPELEAFPASSNTTQLATIRKLCENIEKIKDFQDDRPGQPRAIALFKVVDMIQATLTMKGMSQAFPYLLANWRHGQNFPPPPNAPQHVTGDDAGLRKFRQDEYIILKQNYNNELTANQLILASLFEMLGETYQSTIGVLTEAPGPIPVTTYSLENQTISGAIKKMADTFSITISAHYGNTLQANFEEPFPAEMSLTKCIGTHNENVKQLIRAKRSPHPIQITEQFIKNLLVFHPHFKELVQQFDNAYHDVDQRTMAQATKFLAGRGEQIECKMVKASAQAAVASHTMAYNSAATFSTTPDATTTRANFPRSSAIAHGRQNTYNNETFDLRTINQMLRSNGYTAVRLSNNPPRPPGYQSSNTAKNRGYRDNRNRGQQQRSGQPGRPTYKPSVPKANAAQDVDADYHDDPAETDAINFEAAYHATEPTYDLNDIADDSDYYYDEA